MIQLAFLLSLLVILHTSSFKTYSLHPVGYGKVSRLLQTVAEKVIEPRRRLPKLLLNRNKNGTVENERHKIRKHEIIEPWRNPFYSQAELDVAWRNNDQLLSIGGPGVTIKHINSLHEQLGYHNYVKVKVISDKMNVTAIAERFLNDTRITQIGVLLERRPRGLLFGRQELLPDKVIPVNPFPDRQITKVDKRAPGYRKKMLASRRKKMRKPGQSSLSTDRKKTTTRSTTQDRPFRGKLDKDKRPMKTRSSSSGGRKFPSTAAAGSSSSSRSTTANWGPRKTSFTGGMKAKAGGGRFDKMKANKKPYLGANRNTRVAYKRTLS